MNYAELTDDELRIEVARRCGYRWYAGLDTSAYHLAKPDEKPYHADWRDVDTTSGFYFTNAPDYPHDLTAAYALEDALPVERREAYVTALVDMLGFLDRWAVTHASAADRCRAWLWTMDA